MQFLVAADVPSPLARAIEPVGSVLADGAMASAYPDVTVVVGSLDPYFVSTTPGPIVWVPVTGNTVGPTNPAGLRANAIAVFDLSDVPKHATAPVVLVGTPVPPADPSEPGLQANEASTLLVESVLQQLESDPTAGVSWVTAPGSVGMCQAAAAWQAGRAALPVAPRAAPRPFSQNDLPVPKATTDLIELTALLLRSPPLVRVLVARGRRAPTMLRHSHAIAQGLAEAAELASSTSRGGAGKLPG